MGIQNKTAVIMGGAGAIGKAIAQRYAKEGAKIVIVDLNGEKAKAVAEEIKNQGGSASWICADVAEEPQVEKLTKEILEEYKTIDILVNSVGKFKTMPMMDITVEYWDDMMRNNLRNTFICTNNSYLRRKNVGDEIVDTIVIPQNEDGIDTEDRITLLKNYIKANLS